MTLSRLKQAAMGLVATLCLVVWLWLGSFESGILDNPSLRAPSPDRPHATEVRGETLYLNRTDHRLAISRHAIHAAAAAALIATAWLLYGRSGDSR